MSPTPPRLLILDLNHTLLCRPTRKGKGARKPTPRPYLSTFLHYIFKSEKWHVFVWSSSQPKNVETMVKAINMWPNAPLYGMFTRKDLGLSSEDYFKPVDTVKDMSKLWSLKPEDNHGYHDTVLIDNEEKKGSMQPQNVLVVPEFDPHNTARHKRFDTPKQNTETPMSESTTASSNTTPAPPATGSNVVDENDDSLICVIAKLEQLYKDKNISDSIMEYQKLEKEQKESNIDLNSDWGRPSAHWLALGFEICKEEKIPINKEWDPYWVCQVFGVQESTVKDAIKREDVLGGANNYANQVLQEALQKLHLQNNKNVSN